MFSYKMNVVNKNKKTQALPKEFTCRKIR